MVITTTKKTMPDHRTIAAITDRYLESDSILANAFLVDHNKVATSAHAIILYSDYLPALNVTFPLSKQVFGVEKIDYHPDFAYNKAYHMARKSLAEPNASLPLLDHNVAIISLTEKLTELDSRQLANLEEDFKLPLPQQNSNAFAGSLQDMELALVIQTITTGRKAGSLIITGQRNKPIAQLFLRNGNILHARFEDLVNETAIYQIIAKQIDGKFHFIPGESPTFAPTAPIVRPTDMVLIEAHRRLDEIPKLLQEISGENVILRRSNTELDQSKLAPEAQKNATSLWAFLDGHNSVKTLSRLAKLDNYTVFEALKALIQANQVQISPPILPEPEKLPEPLRLGRQIALYPADSIYSLYLDPILNIVEKVEGQVLGSLRPGDSVCLMHNLGLDKEATGAPIIKDDVIIGMHSGNLPANRKLSGIAPSLQQFLFVESIYQCLHPAKHQSSKERVLNPGQITTGGSLIENAGCIELAKIKCPNCGAENLGLAKSCHSCSQNLFQEDSQSVKPIVKFPLKKAILIAASILALIVLPILAMNSSSFISTLFNNKKIGDGKPSVIKTDSGYEIYKSDKGNNTDLSSDSSKTDELEPDYFLEDHIHKLYAGNFRDAYEELSTAFQTKQDFNTYFLKCYKTKYRTNSNLSKNSVEIASQSQDKAVVLVNMQDVTGEKRKERVSLVKENGNWKIDSGNLSESGQSKYIDEHKVSLSTQSKALQKQYEKTQNKKYQSISKTKPPTKTTKQQTNSNFYNSKYNKYQAKPTYSNNNNNSAQNELYKELYGNSSYSNNSQPSYGGNYGNSGQNYNANNTYGGGYDNTQQNSNGYVPNNSGYNSGNSYNSGSGYSGGYNQSPSNYQGYRPSNNNYNNNQYGNGSTNSYSSGTNSTVKSVGKKLLQYGFNQLQGNR